MLSRIATALGGLLFGIAIIAVFELILAAFGVGDDAPLHDPFAGFSSAVPMFEVAAPKPGDERREPVYRLSPARGGQPHLVEPEPQREFSVEKPADEFRIFVIGGSSSQGVPYSTNYAFSSWLERRLGAGLPEIDVKVVNAAMSGYASRRILPIVHEIAQYQPDALIVYMGHNEWAEAMYYEHLLNIDPRLFELLEWGYRTRIYALASRLLNLEALQKAPEVDLDSSDNAQQMFGVLRERAAGKSLPTGRERAFRDILYEHNMRSVARAMKPVGAKLVFLTLSQNFSDWPPPASLHRDGLSEAELGRWQQLVTTADQRFETGEWETALTSYQQALKIDGEFAELHFRVANCHRRLSRNELALQHYRLASDLDAVPHGAVTRFNEVIRQIADDEGALLVDIDAALIEESGDGLVGDDLFTDFVHPNIRAHQRIAAAVSQAMRAAGFPVEAEGWQDGYVDPAPSDLYRSEPRLEVLELQSRVFVCLLAPREACPEETARLVAVDPHNKVAGMVLARLAGRPSSQREPAE